jgi:hypothetical protein
MAARISTPRILVAEKLRRHAFDFLIVNQTAQAAGLLALLTKQKLVVAATYATF